VPAVAVKLKLLGLSKSRLKKRLDFL